MATLRSPIDDRAKSKSHFDFAMEKSPGRNFSGLIGAECLILLTQLTD